MDKYHFRIVVSGFLYKNIGVYRAFETQGELADYLSVRPATVSSWINKNSCISAFVLFQILFGVVLRTNRKFDLVIADFLEILLEVEKNVLS